MNSYSVRAIDCVKCISWKVEDVMHKAAEGAAAPFTLVPLPIQHT